MTTLIVTFEMFCYLNSEVIMSVFPCCYKYCFVNKFFFVSNSLKNKCFKHKLLIDILKLYFAKCILTKI